MRCFLFPVLIILYCSKASSQSITPDLSDKGKKTRILLEYLGDTFDRNYSDWTLVSAGISRKEKPLTALAKVNVAERFRLTGSQVELELYPKLGKRSYAFLNIAASGSEIFPRMRYGAEVYRGLPLGLELSLGIRYLTFTGSETVIYTGSLSKYAGNFFISLKPFINPLSERTSTAVLFLVRHYLKDIDNYVSLNFLYGLSPDDPGKEKLLENPQYLKSVRFFADFKKEIFSQKLIVKGLLAYENREYNPGNFLNQYSFSLGLEIPF